MWLIFALLVPCCAFQFSPAMAPASGLPPLPGGERLAIEEPGWVRARVRNSMSIGTLLFAKSRNIDRQSSHRRMAPARAVRCGRRQAPYAGTSRRKTFAGASEHRACVFVSLYLSAKKCVISAYVFRGEKMIVVACTAGAFVLELGCGTGAVGLYAAVRGDGVSRVVVWAIVGDAHTETAIDATVDPHTQGACD